MTETILANATLVLPDETRRGALRLDAGRIAEIGDGAAVPPGAVDCGGDLLAPGLIELHTDNLERHIQPRPKVAWPHAAAIIAHDAELAGTGITTVFDALRVGSVVSRGKANYGEYARALATEILDLRAKGALRISHFLHLRAEVCSETLIAEMAEFGPEDRVGIVSLMDHTPGQRQFRDIDQAARLCHRQARPVRGRIRRTCRRTAAAARPARGPRTRPPRWPRPGATARCWQAMTTRIADHVAVSAGHGIGLAEFPTTVEAAEACRAAGIAVMMGAPNLIRGGSHSGNVAAAELAGRGLLDILSSDYVPSALLSAAVLLGDIWDDRARGFATVTAAPAAATGLTDRGRHRPRPARRPDPAAAGRAARRWCARPGCRAPASPDPSTEDPAMPSTSDAFTAPGRFWRGNLHTHSTRSDGVLEPEEVCRRYRAEGYDFLALTDHFIGHFGYPITDTTAFRDNRFTTILGAELHSGAMANGELWHILAVGLPEDFAPGHAPHFRPVEGQESGAETGRPRRRRRRLRRHRAPAMVGADAGRRARHRGRPCRRDLQPRLRRGLRPGRRRRDRRSAACRGPPAEPDRDRRRPFLGTRPFRRLGDGEGRGKQPRGAAGGAQGGGVLFLAGPRAARDRGRGQRRRGRLLVGPHRDRPGRGQRYAGGARVVADPRPAAARPAGKLALAAGDGHRPCRPARLVEPLLAIERNRIRLKQSDPGISLRLLNQSEIPFRIESI